MLSIGNQDGDDDDDQEGLNFDWTVIGHSKEAIEI